MALIVGYYRIFWNSDILSSQPRRKMMEAFDRLFKIMDELLAPGGCPWDREQTIESLRSTVLEETCELIEAIDLGDSEHIREELGDLAFNVVFFCRLGEKEGRFTTEEVLTGISEKLLRRHPHVFGDVKVGDTDEALVQWEAIKAKEKGAHRESRLDSLPHHLPGLLRAYKSVKRMRDADLPAPTANSDEEEYGLRLLDLVREGRELGIDPECALRKVLAKQESAYREWEKSRV